MTPVSATTPVPVVPPVPPTVTPVAPPLSTMAEAMVKVPVLFCRTPSVPPAPALPVRFPPVIVCVLLPTEEEAMMVPSTPRVLLPPIVTVIPLYLLAKSLGLFDTYWILIAIYTLSGLPLVVWVCWSRVELGDHTLAEVLSGAVMGLVVGGLGFWAFLAALHS